MIVASCTARLAENWAAPDEVLRRVGVLRKVQVSERVVCLCA
jgi:hypothetical protein